MKHKLLLMIVAGIAGAGAGWWFTEAVLRDDPPPVFVDNTPTAKELIGQARPDFTLGSTTGEILNASDFDGDVVLINFWATWCEPCREEMPMLSALYEQKKSQGFHVLGIALDDVQQAREFVEELGIGYPNLVGGADVMATGVAYGNRAGLLPYSVLVDRQGIIRWTSLGELERAELDTRIGELL